MSIDSYVESLRVINVEGVAELVATKGIRQQNRKLTQALDYRESSNLRERRIFSKIAPIYRLSAWCPLGNQCKICPIWESGIADGYFITGIWCNRRYVRGLERAIGRGYLRNYFVP